MAISLTKGQKLNLSKNDGTVLSQVRLGLGWDPIKTRGLFGITREKAVDLDASVIAFSGNQVAEVVFYGALRNANGSITHHGDNLTGAGDGDDEVIDINLPGIDPSITALALIITSYSRDRFDNIENAFVRIEDAAARQEIARFTVTDKGSHTGLMVAVLNREGNGWAFNALGIPFKGVARTPRDVIAEATSYI